jgi:hypothetical protein
MVGRLRVAARLSSRADSDNSRLTLRLPPFVLRDREALDLRLREWDGDDPPPAQRHELVSDGVEAFEHRIGRLPAGLAVGIGEEVPPAVQRRGGDGACDVVLVERACELLTDAAVDRLGGARPREERERRQARRAREVEDAAESAVGLGPHDDIDVPVDHVRAEEQTARQGERLVLERDHDERRRM